MKNLINHAVTYICAALLFTGCAEDDDFTLDGTHIKMSEIAGTWNATYVAYYKSGEGPATEYDLIEEGGSATLSIQTNGRFALAITPFGESTTTTTGQLEFDEDLLVVTYDDFPDDWEYFSIQLANDQLTLYGPAEFDFDNDGTPEEASIELILEK